MSDATFYGVLLLFAVVYLALLTIDQFDRWRRTMQRTKDFHNSYREIRQQQTNSVTLASRFDRPASKGFSAQNERRRHGDREEVGARDQQGLHAVRRTASKSRVN